jgi:hypothetical protein
MPGGSGPTDLYLLATDLLEAAVASLDEISTFDVSLAGAPERRYVAPEEPAWDCCEQLVVYAPGLMDQLTSPLTPTPVIGTRHRVAHIPLTRLAVQVGRCVPQGKLNGGTWTPPTAEAIDASAQQVMADGWALYNGIYNRLYQGLLSDRCSEVEWNGVAPFSPNDDCAGWIMSFRFQLDGYGATDPIST